MSDVKNLKEERNQLFKDVFNSKIPKRVPVCMTMTFEALAGYGGVDLLQAQWNPVLVEKTLDDVCQKLYSDTAIYGGTLRLPSVYNILKSQSFVMGSNGFIQHPEVIGMLPEDYDYLIENPYDCIIERILPRQYKAFDFSDPGNAMLSLTKAVFAWAGDNEVHAKIVSAAREKYGYADYSIATDGFTAAPADFLADQLRSFKGFSMDIRRCPEKVLEACEALYPFIKKMGLPMEVREHCHVYYPLHMPTFMREKDFAKYWWTSFKKLCEDYASMGICNEIFCEDDWTRYLDYLQELPVNSVLFFEYGDAKKIKEKLGDRHIISGLFPLTYLKNHTKQECIDLAKKYIDDLAPGGKYIFSFDKEPLSASDLNFENYCAVAETVRDYGVYSNPGEPVGEVYRKEDYKPQTSRPFSSKYYTTWSQNDTVTDVGASNIQGLDEMLFAFISLLLM